MKTPNYEGIEAYLASPENEKTLQEMKDMVRAKEIPSAMRGAGTFTDKVREYWTVVEPIIRTLAALPILPKLWRTALTAFIMVMEAYLAG